MATIPQVLERIHIINGQITPGLLKSSRYFPSSLDVGHLPLITATVGRNRPDDNSNDLKRPIRDFTLVLYVGYMALGVPSETALKNAEQLIDPVYEAYYRRTRLELTPPSTGALSGIRSAQLTGDGGIVAETPNQAGSLAIIRFTLTINLLKSF